MKTIYYEDIIVKLHILFIFGLCCFLAIELGNVSTKLSDMEEFVCEHEVKNNEFVFCELSGTKYKFKDVQQKGVK
jgi:hypothetical protein